MTQMPILTKQRQMRTGKFSLMFEFFLWSLPLVLWSFSLFHSLSLGVNEPLDLMLVVFHCTFTMYWPRVCSFCCNCVERQILWRLYSVDFLTFTLQLPIQSLHSVLSEQENCQNFNKTSTPQGRTAWGSLCTKHRAAPSYQCAQRDNFRIREYCWKEVGREPLGIR